MSLTNRSIKQICFFVNERLRPDQRIRKKADFKSLFEKGRFQRGALLNLWVYEENRGRQKPRLGMIVSRKTHAQASGRNVWKRRIREAFRRIQGNLKQGVDILVQSKKQEKIPTYPALKIEMENLLKKIGVWL